MRLIDNSLTFLESVIPTTTFEMDYEYDVNLYNPELLNGVKVTFKASSSLTAPGSGFGAIDVSKGEVSTDFENVLPNLGVSAGSTDYQNITSLTASLAQQVGDGTIYLKTKLEGTQFTLSMQFDYLKLPVVLGTDGYNSTMSVTLSMTWDSSDPDITGVAPVQDPTPVWEKDGEYALLAVGIVVLLPFLPVDGAIAALGTAVGAVASSIAGFLAAVAPST